MRSDPISSDPKRFDPKRFDPKRSDPKRLGGLRSALAFGLILAATGATRAEPRPAWVDPPAKAAPGTAPSPSPTAPAAETQAQRSPERRLQEEDATRSTAAAAAAGPGARLRDAEPAQAAVTVAPDEGAASMAGPGRVADRAQRRRRSARRQASPPAALAPTTLAPTTLAAAPSDPRFDDWAGQARGLTDAYLAAFSGSNGAMVSGAARFYGERLRFHGRLTTIAALLDEKRRFAQRWPERHYAPRDTRTACNAALQSCVVRTLVDFRADSPARGARSQGVAELVLEVSFAGGRPVIVSESSRVLRRGATAGTLPGGAANG